MMAKELKSGQMFADQIGYRLNNHNQVRNVVCDVILLLLIVFLFCRPTTNRSNSIYYMMNIRNIRNDTTTRSTTISIDNDGQRRIVSSIGNHLRDDQASKWLQ
jgi:biopolymer transport protein ExbD